MMRIILLACCLVGPASPACALDVLLEHFDVFTNGEVIEGLSYNTYRIPNIARANDGTLVAVAEARLTGSSDPGGTHIDLVYKRSLDGGKTWTAGQILDRHPDSALANPGNPVFENNTRTSASNSVTFVDRSSGRVWNFNMRLPHATPSSATQPGVDDMQTWARFSDDSGTTWSTPTHIVGNSADIPYEDFYPNLGSATQLSSGRLVVPATENNATVSAHSFALYSDDAGVTWKAGTQIDAGTNEAQIAELTDGRLLMTARQNGGGGRKFAISDDQGETWNSSFNGFSSTTVMEAVERYTASGVNGETVNRLLHTIPVGPPNRHNLEVMTATNETNAGGPTFGNNRRIFHGRSAYSDLVNIDGDEVGTLFEGENGRITYSRFNRAFLEPTGQTLGLIAVESFDYQEGVTLDDVDPLPPVEGGYDGGHAPVSFSAGAGFDLGFTVDMDAGVAGTATIDPGLVPNERANGIFGQVFTTENEAGPVTQITVQRADTSTANPDSVFLHVYSDIDVTDGIDAGTFLGSSLTAESLNPTDSGLTAWTFDGVSTVLAPETQYLFAFANTATPGDTTTARAALLEVGGLPVKFANGGNGFNSTWRGNATDLTDSSGAGDAKVVAGSLEYTSFRILTDGGHAQIDHGGEIARGLGVGLDLNADATFYASLLVSRSADAGPDDATGESLELALLDSAGATHIRFGVDDNEAFFLDGPGGLVATANDALNPASNYFLVLKVVAQDNSNSANVDQLFMKVFESGDAIPDFDDNLAWTLVGNADTNVAATIDRLSIVGGAKALWSLDELRVGGDFGSVASGVGFTFAGDLNLDGVLDLFDWIEFKANFQLDTSALGTTTQLIVGDFDQSGRINAADFIAFRDLYDAVHGQGAFGALATQVPEPPSLVLMALIALLSKTARFRSVGTR